LPGNAFIEPSAFDFHPHGHYARSKWALPEKKLAHRAARIPRTPPRWLARAAFVREGGSVRPVEDSQAMSLGGSINYLKGEEAAKADQTMQRVDFRPSELWK
jgi:hypothetical protein